MLWRIDPHTTIKHLVYRHYLGCWMGKVLQKFPEAAIIDGFAGPGEYECGADGSPIIVAKMFLDHHSSAKLKHLHLVAQEERSDRVQHLVRQVVLLRVDPRLHIDVREPASFPVVLTTLTAVAHRDNERRPVLWILDPYNWEPVPATVVDACLRGPRDEVMLTFFVDEVYRFMNSPAHETAITRYLGTDEWKELRTVSHEGMCKSALIDLYCRRLRDGSGVLTGQFSIGVKNQTPRYAIIFATHSPAGLECWNPVTWRLDHRGGQILALKPEQLDMFATGMTPTEKLAADLKRFEGREVKWDELMAFVRRSNFLDKHVREALSLLAVDGLALRVDPLDSRSPWPDGSVVRFYTSSDVEEA